MRFELKTSTNLQCYPSALKVMENRVQAIQHHTAPPLVWFLEHPSLFTQGRSSKEDLVLPLSYPIFKSSRGGKTTYHGPGQRIIYVMMNLEEHGKDVKLFVHFLEEWVIEALSYLGVKGKRAAGRTGVWIDTPAGEKKIAALGVRVHKWITSHGVSLNVSPTLASYNEIIPCGIKEYGVTSLKELGIPASLERVDQILLSVFPSVFQRVMKGPTHGDRKT